MQTLTNAHRIRQCPNLQEVCAIGIIPSIPAADIWHHHANNLSLANFSIPRHRRTAKASPMVAMLRAFQTKGFLVSASAPPSSVELHAQGTGDRGS